MFAAKTNKLITTGIRERMETSETLLEILWSPLDNRRSGAVEPSSPLTPTLSLREREQRAGVEVCSNAGPSHLALRIAMNMGNGLALPKREGRGEGKANGAQPTVQR
jgi:hypothetical protein